MGVLYIKRIIWTLLLLIQLGFGKTVCAQSNHDSTYIQKFPDSLNLRIILVQKGLRLKAQNKQQNQRYFFTPWHRNYVGVGGFLWNIGFNILIPVSPSLRENNLKRFDFQGSLFARNWLIDGIYQRYRGFVQADRQFNPRAAPELYQQNMMLKKIQATITYLPSGDKFSLSFPFNQGFRQRKSGGSLMLSGDFSYKKLAEDGYILPQEDLALSDPARGLSEFESFSLTTMIGYGATLVHRNYFLHVFGLTGLGFQNIRYQTSSANRRFAIEPTYDIRGAVGYDQGDWYTGIYVSSDYTLTDIEGWQFIARTSQIRYYIGIRINEPGFLRRIKPKFLKNLLNSPDIPLPFFG